MAQARLTARAAGTRAALAFGLALSLALTLVLALSLGTASPAAAQSPTDGPLPVPFDISAGVRAGVFPETPPPGANDWNCRPSAAHPHPVVLVNPTGTNQALAWQAGAPLLKNAGYCVFTFNYGNPEWISEIPIQGLADIPTSARTLSDTVDRVLAATGAEQVDLVGHSQGGGILPDYYLTQLGGAAKVHTKVGISPSTGTTMSEVVYLRSLIPLLGPAVYGSLAQATPALTQQAVGSPLMRQVYPSGRPTGIDGVHVYSIITRYDEVVTPYDQQFYRGGDVTNILLQDACAADHSEHISTLYNERSWLFVLNALDPAHAQPVPCFYQAPFAPWVH
ncbi:esterase/lipase family protein [Tomitella gaofuii]|uniref:esterase/lipase family protein n=1 Tax=Tomitella gaofuii TaxID=2760083 RepID=UPI0015FCE604|nr:alpha/beta fold hydrolase [Tomitella gaofuii]